MHETNTYFVYQWLSFLLEQDFLCVHDPYNTLNLLFFKMWKTELRKIEIQIMSAQEQLLISYGIV